MSGNEWVCGLKSISHTRKEVECLLIALFVLVWIESRCLNLFNHGYVRQSGSSPRAFDIGGKSPSGADSSCFGYPV